MFYFFCNHPRNNQINQLLCVHFSKSMVKNIFMVLNGCHGMYLTELNRYDGGAVIRSNIMKNYAVWIRFARLGRQTSLQKFSVTPSVNLHHDQLLWRFLNCSPDRCRTRIRGRELNAHLWKRKNNENAMSRTPSQKLAKFLHKLAERHQGSVTSWTSPSTGISSDLIHTVHVHV